MFGPVIAVPGDSYLVKPFYLTNSVGMKGGFLSNV